MSKVVLSPSNGDRAGLRIDAVSTESQTRTPAGTELHLGSQDLIRLASYALAHGFQVSSFMVADAYLVPLMSDEEAFVSEEMIVTLSAHGCEELEAAMRDEYDGLYIVGVNLVASSSGMQISVRRRGYVYTSVVQEAEELLEAAWRELHLS